MEDTDHILGQKWCKSYSVMSCGVYIMMCTVRPSFLLHVSAVLSLSTQQPSIEMKMWNKAENFYHPLPQQPPVSVNSQASASSGVVWSTLTFCVQPDEPKKHSQEKDLPADPDTGLQEGSSNPGQLLS